VDKVTSDPKANSRCRLVAVVVAVTGVLCTAGSRHAYGQAGAPLPQTYLQQQRQIEERIRRSLEEHLPPTQKWQIDAGGWFSYYLFLFDDGLNSSRTQRRYDGRLWIGGSGDYGTHEFYARLKLSYIDWNRGDSFDGNEDDAEGPNADRLWYQFDLKQAAKTYGRTDLPFGLKVKVGRQFVEFGTGYALSLPLDAVRITTQVQDFQIEGLLAKTIASTPDIDRSRANSGSMRRHFLGVELKYTGSPRHEPFAYIFWNLDENHEPWDLLQKFGYDSLYVGIGSQGQLNAYVRYSAELVYQAGRSYGDGRFTGRDPINAMGLDLLVEYLGPGKKQPRLAIEYMFASGDADRLDSPTNAIGGNRRGTDNSFVAFGYRDTGLSFAPLLSNVHIWRAGASCTPFPQTKALERLQVGTDWFLYCKNKARAAVSDITADRPSSYLGWEMDYFANWQLTSELAATVRYGVFFPGKAFSDKTTRTFLLAGLTWSF